MRSHYPELRKIETPRLNFSHQPKHNMVKRKRQSEALESEAPQEDTAVQPVPVEVIDVIPGDQPAFSGWDDPAIEAAQAGWPEKTGVRECMVSLTDSEVVKISDEKLSVEDDLESAEGSASAAKAHWKAVTERLSGEVKRLREILRDKKERREVPTRWIFGFRAASDGTPIPDGNCKTLIRTDTGEAVTHDAISDEDRQPNLFPDEELPELPEPEEDAADEPEGETDEDTDEEA